MKLSKNVPWLMIGICDAFIIDPACVSPNTRLYGLKKYGNKQAALREKLKQAKIQNGELSDTESSDRAPLSDDEIKEQNDRKRFADLLERGGAGMLNEFGSTGYRSQAQEEEDLGAARAQVERLFEGDPIPDDTLSPLVDIQTGNPIGEKGASRLLPKGDDYLVIVTDPRSESDGLREALRSLQALPNDIKSRLVIINADRPNLSRKWLKKNDLVGKVRLYSDQSKESMKKLTALGENRWSMTMFVVAHGKVQKLARDVNQYAVLNVVQNAVKSLMESRA